MKYILDRRYLFRGWYKNPAGLFDRKQKAARFFPKDLFLLLLKCDGVQEIEESALDEKSCRFLNMLLDEGVIRPAAFGEFLHSDQLYKEYPSRYRREVHWSVTGACNLKCRHCFMSAPGAKHGTPSHEEIIRVADELAECGIFSVGITGGEPLIRSDFLAIIDALNEREIGVGIIYTNGWLVNEQLLDELDARKVHPAFQLSFDGVGSHDWLRGVPGSEEQVIRALELLKERHHGVSVSLCMNKKNCDRLRESVNLMAGLGVRSMKCGSMMDLGEWMSPDLAAAKLSQEEEIEAFEKYIPLYFADDAPLSIMLGGAFMYTPGDPKWSIFHERKVTPGEEHQRPSCGVLSKNFYIGADGMVTPCMGMADCGIADIFPNLKETPLREILRESEFVNMCYATVGDIRDRNPKCRACRFIDRCAGGCRNSVVTKKDDYYGYDPLLCEFFENGYDERIRKAAEPAFLEYIKRNPPK